jgi:hypothetical protein
MITAIVAGIVALPSSAARTSRSPGLPPWSSSSFSAIGEKLYGVGAVAVVRPHGPA